MTRTACWIAVLVLGVSLCETSGWAHEGHGSTASKDITDEMLGRYNLHPAFEKGGRGVSNLLLGWLEIPLTIHKRYTTSDVVASFLTGTAIGAFKAVMRTGVGAYETVTFFLPYPEDFAPILPTLEYFQRQTRRKPYPLE